VSFDKQKLAAAVVLLSPFIPLIFMGEEYGERAPFQYFIDHSVPALVEAVRRGRREESAAFGWPGEIPDPQDRATFLRSRVDHTLKDAGCHRVLLDYYRELFRLRREVEALRSLSKKNMEVNVFEETRLLCVRRWWHDSEAVMVGNFADEGTSVKLRLPAGHWRKAHDSAAEKWLGPGSRLPAEFDSTGGYTLTMEKSSLVLYARRPLIQEMRPGT
jgi:maltooligosyltrehalose trehalohydrolase